MNPINTEITEPTAAPETTETIAGHRVHRAAALLPEPSPEEYARLKNNIMEYGMRIPIVMTPDGQILDGRTRAQIIDELLTEGFLPSVSSRVATTDEMLDPVAFVLSVNAIRRHLTGDQIIAIYLEANKAKLEAEKQAAKATQQANLKKGATHEPESTTVKPSGKTAAKIAKSVGKSKSAVERVQRVQKVAPERMADVAAGKISASEVLKAKAPKTIKAEPHVTEQNVKAPTNEQPAPKKLKPGSRAWFESRISDLKSITFDLRDQAAVSKLTRDQHEHVVKAIENAQHFERIANDPARVVKVSLALVKLWNESGGTQIEIEGEYSKYQMQQVYEAVACELNFDRWASAIKAATGLGGQWVTDRIFTDLIIVRDGKPVGLECHEDDLRQWVADAAGGAPPEPAP